MERIRVLEVAEAAGGGVLRHLLQIIEHVDPAEFELTVAVSTARMPEPERTLDRFRRAGARVELVPMKRRVAPFADLAAYGHLLRLIERDRYDVVHGHSSKAGVLARRAAARLRVARSFYTPHAYAFQRGGLLGRLYRWLERRAAACGGTVLAVSDGEARQAVECAGVPRERVRVVPTAIEPPDLPGPAERRAARAALGLPLDAPVVGTVGRLARQKGCDVFCRAAALVARERPDARFVLIGDGPDRAKLERLARSLGLGDRVVFAGYRADAAGLCAAFDLYAQLSRWEGLAFALLDAMGRGLPVVASDISGNRDVVRPGTTGRLAPAGDPVAAARAMCGLLADAAGRAALGAAARELVLRDHDLAGFVRRVSALYRGEDIAGSE